MQSLTGERDECGHIEYGHKSDTDIAQIPYEGIGCKTSNEEHCQCQQLVQCLGKPVVSEQISHVGAGIKQDADKSGKAEQPQDHSNK